MEDVIIRSRIDSVLGGSQTIKHRSSASAGSNAAELLSRGRPFAVHVHGGSPFPGGAPHFAESSPIAIAMGSSFKIRGLEPALPMESTTPREHVH